MSLDLRPMRRKSIHSESLIQMAVFAAIFLLAIFAQSLFAQSKGQQFRNLQRPVKCWILSHPFIANKAFDVSRQALAITDSISKTIGGNAAGSRGDAFRHGFWMCSLALKFSSKKAKKLGIAYEKGNYLQFKKGELEDNAIQDSVASAMDLFNNEIGLEIADSLQKLGQTNVSARIDAILNGIEKGEFKIVSAQNGEMLDCEGNIIPEKEWKGIWKNRRCLVKSNQISSSTRQF